MSADDDLTRGRNAAAVLENDAYREAYAKVDEALVKAWRESRDSRDREDLHHMLGLLTRVQAVMEAAMRNGQITDSELLRKRKFSERMGLVRS